MTHVVIKQRVPRLILIFFRGERMYKELVLASKITKICIIMQIFFSDPSCLILDIPVILMAR